MSTVEEKNVVNQGTNQAENGLSVPQNSIDLDTEDAQKAFAEAYKKASGITEQKTEAVIPDTPAILEPEKKQIEEVTEEKKVVDDKEPSQVQKTEAAKAEVTEQEKKDSPYAWVDSLPKDIQDKVRKEIDARAYNEHRFKSEVGRQNALQQKSLRLERELADLRSKVIKPQDPALAAAANADQAKSLADWNTLIEADPSLAKAVESRIQAERTALESKFEQRLSAQTDPLYQHSLDSHAERERQLLAQQVPNYLEVVNSPVWNYWINNVAAPGIQQLARDSNDHRDAITVLRAYASEAKDAYEYLVNTGQMQAAAPAVQQQQEAVHNQQEQQKQIEAKDTSHADKVAQSRQQKVQAAPVVPQAPNPIATPSANSLGTTKIGDSIDIEDPSVLAYFEAEYKKNSMARR